MSHIPIDIVYLWVDGSDENWARQKAEWMERETGAKPDGTHASRFRDNGEFMYSMRSVAECAPWVNHIYIITGFGQVPKWLNTAHPKITIVPHEQIIPADALPTFNSNAIEMCIPNIPGLSEHFLLMNDDMFFNRALTPDFFYDASGRAQLQYTHKPVHPVNPTPYVQTLLKSEDIIHTATGCLIRGRAPAHGIDPYIKSSWVECANNPYVKPYIEETIHTRFRTENDIQRWAFNLYDIAKGRATMTHAPSYKNTKIKILNFVYNSLRRRKMRNTSIYTMDAMATRRGIMNAPIFCINDTPKTPDDARRGNAEFLEWRFPNKCEFEK